MGDACALKLVRLPDGTRIATCTDPSHDWAKLAPGTGYARAKVRHRQHAIGFSE